MTDSCDFCKNKAMFEALSARGKKMYLCEQHAKTIPHTQIKAVHHAEQPKTKRCTMCGEEKSISEFYKTKNAFGKTYLRPECKKCFQEARRLTELRKALNSLKQK